VGTSWLYRLAAAEALTRAVTEAVATGDWVAELAAARGLEAFVGTLAGRSDPVEAEVRWVRHRVVVWRWGSDETMTSRSDDDRVFRRRPGVGTPHAPALYFLLENFAARYSLERVARDSRAWVNAHPRPGTGGFFTRINVHLSGAEERVTAVRVSGTLGRRSPSHTLRFLGEPEPIPGPPLPESCFTVPGEPDGESACPLEEPR
jgi:hypothetical protein